jgi:formylglycine-generating enzyme required for sulfatase activity
MQEASEGNGRGHERMVNTTSGCSGFADSSMIRRSIGLLSVVCYWAFFPQYGFAQSSTAAVLPQGSRQATAPAFSQPLEDLSDCPLLPGCPSGPSVPLPPFRIDSGNQKTPGSQVDENTVTVGTGKFHGMVLIPAGRFMMGSEDSEGRPDERPAHSVFLKEFYIGQHEVTAREFCDFLNAQGEISREGISRIKLDSPDCPIVKKTGNSYQPKPGYADKPVVMTSW